jgi:hypothetical protein
LLSNLKNKTKERERERERERGKYAYEIELNKHCENKQIAFITCKFIKRSIKNFDTKV